MHLPIVIICLASYWIVLYLLYRAALISPAAIQVLLGEVHTNHLWELTGFRTPAFYSVYTGRLRQREVPVQALKG